MLNNISSHKIFREEINHVFWTIKMVPWTIFASYILEEIYENKYKKSKMSDKWK